MCDWQKTPRLWLTYFALKQRCLCCLSLTQQAQEREGGIISRLFTPISSFHQETCSMFIGPISDQPCLLLERETLRFLVCLCSLEMMKRHWSVWHCRGSWSGKNPCFISWPFRWTVVTVLYQVFLQSLPGPALAVGVLFQTGMRPRCPRSGCSGVSGGQEGPDGVGSPGRGTGGSCSDFSIKFAWLFHWPHSYLKKTDSFLYRYFFKSGGKLFYFVYQSSKCHQQGAGLLSTSSF